MSPVQKVFTKILPKKWAHHMEEDSRRWMVQCACGYERSVWELGGIRWKARGTPRRYTKCPACHKSSWHKVYKRHDPI